MKKAFAVAVVALVLIDAGWHLMEHLLQSIDRGKHRRVLADVRAVATAIHAYSDQTGEYPIAMNKSALSKLLSPTFIRTLPPDDLDYFSDGRTYAFILWPWGRSPYPMKQSGYGPLEMRDETLVAWPEWAGSSPPLRPMASDAARPNSARGPTLSSATPLAPASPARADQYGAGPLLARIDFDCAKTSSLPDKQLQPAISQALQRSTRAVKRGPTGLACTT